MQHLHDLSLRAYHCNCPSFTDFLTSGELSLLIQNKCSFSSVQVELWGGHEDCDHKMAGFFPEGFEGNNQDEFPIICIQITAANEKYAKEITHRDYLGAILNLGIERSTIGDIRICDETAYVFCNRELVPFILTHLDRVRHTAVKCRQLIDVSEIPDRQYKTIYQSVASLRLDNVVAAMTGTSRGKTSELILQGKVIAGGEEKNSNSFRCRNDMVISIRGHGKYRLWFEEGDKTKKGKQKITIYQYL